MTRRYELPDASWELIKDLVSPEQKLGRPRSDDRLVLHCGFCARALPGATTVRLTGYWSACTSN